MSNWKVCKLGEVVNLKRGYDLSNVHRINGNIPIYSSSGITDYHHEAKVDGPGVITGRYGTIGQVFYAKGKYWPLNTTLYVQDFKGNNPLFIYYFLKCLDFEKFNDKSAVPGINRNDVHMEMVSIPPLPKQKDIAEVLSSLDDKIELLYRQNKTLEEMAQTLFRQWFVEEAKVDWSEKSLYDAIELIGGGTPRTDVAEFWNGNIQWISAKDISPNYKSFIINTEKAITQEGVNSSSTKLLPKFSTVISARGTVGKYCILAEPMAFSQSNYGIIPKIKDCYFFTYLLIGYCVDELQAAAYGTVFDTITSSTFKENIILLPNEAEILEFEKMIKPSFERMFLNSKQICTLSNMRDSLMPKLMSGEISINSITKN